MSRGGRTLATHSINRGGEHGGVTKPGMALEVVAGVGDNLGQLGLLVEEGSAVVGADVGEVEDGLAAEGGRDAEAGGDDGAVEPGVLRDELHREKRKRLGLSSWKWRDEK